MNIKMTMHLAVCVAVAHGAYGADAPLKFMTYNVAYCRYQQIVGDVTNIVSDASVAAARISADAPDFVALNEMSAGKTYGGVDQPARLGELTGMHHVFGEAFLSSAGGRYGVAILSREEPLSWWTVPLTNWIESVGGEWEKIGYEPRVLLVCEFGDFCVATSHLDTQATHREHWLPVILAELAKCAKPVFFMGDWNSKPTSAELSSIMGSFTVVSPTSGARTFHDHKATGGSIIDYIAVDTAHADDFHVARSYVVEDIVTSDHNPVMVEIYRRPSASELGWVDESFLATGRTGTWSPAISWDASTWKAELGGDAVFTPATPSGGNVVTMDMTVAFDAVPNEEATPDDTAQGAVWLGTNGGFQIWTLGNVANSDSQSETGVTGGIPMWVDVAAEGVTPQMGVDYTLRFVFDYRSRTYSVAVQYGAVWKPLTVAAGTILPAGAGSFPLAVGASGISCVKFSGDGVFTSLLGEWTHAMSGFHFIIR